MQAGFRPRHCLNDLVMLADLAIDQSSKSSSSIAIGFIDLEKTFNSVPRAQLLQVPLDQYSINPSTVEYIRQMYQDTTDHVPGASRSF